VFRTTHIRSKLAVALAIPLAALVAIAGFEVYTASQDLDRIESQTDLASSSLGPGSLLIRLQDERNRAAIDLIGLGDSAGLPVATNAEARGLTDTAIAELEDQMQGRGGTVKAAFAPAGEALTGLADLRADIDAYTGPMDLSNDELANEVFTRYTTIVESFFGATSTVALAVDDADLRNGIEIVDAAARQSEMRARLVRSIVLAVVTGTTDSPAVGQEVSALYDRGRSFDSAIRTNAVGPYAGVADSTFTEPGVQSFNRQVEAFLAGEDVSIGDLLGAVKSQPDIGYLGLRTRAATILGREAQSIQDAAAARERTFGLIALGSLVLALFATWMASRSITRPLRALRTQAEHMAGTSLPAAVRQILDTPPGEDVVIPEVEPITVSSRDEVAEVAAALSAVQASAVDLAVEQAVLRRNISDSYINLGRRNQNLLSRQLDFITDLERNESDPDTLEGLFRLDHLATRMRRNAESLLVLAGIEPPRQWSAPVKVSDVVRAALGEVEDYQRVVVRHLEPAALTGAVAADVAHVLAELLENALSFSPPEQSVEVKGRLTTGGYTIAITDNGLGMGPDDLERANRRLAGKESFTVAPSRYLGHYVAGHLASRLGVVVELQDSPAGGITARVDVPMGLLANEETDPRLAGIAMPDGEVVRSTPTPDVLPPAEPREVEPVAPTAQLPDAPSAPVDPMPPPACGAAPSLTPSGLPRRGDRSQPEVTAPAAAADASPAPVFDAPPRPAEQAPAAEPMPAFGADNDSGLVARHLASEPAAEAEQPTRQPAPLPARGFGGLAVTRPTGGSMYSVAAGNARGHGAEAQSSHSGPTPEAGSAPASATTPTGLARRVPGAQRPDAAFGRAEADAAAPAPAAEPMRSTPEDVYSFLSSFQSGVARGRADAHAESDTETMEGGR
jgi:signal transduction histidine kinase